MNKISDKIVFIRGLSNLKQEKKFRRRNSAKSDSRIARGEKKKGGGPALESRTNTQTRQSRIGNLVEDRELYNDFLQLREPDCSVFDCRGCLRGLRSLNRCSLAAPETQPALSDFRWGSDLRVASGIWKPMNTAIVSPLRRRETRWMVSTLVSTTY